MKTGDVHALAHDLRDYAHKWEEIGLALGFLPDELQNIKYSLSTLEERFEEVLHLWSQWPNGCPLASSYKLEGALDKVKLLKVGGCIDSAGLSAVLGTGPQLHTIFVHNSFLTLGGQVW